jgi:hypothetical protein
MPRYPIFVPSKGRADKEMTAAMFDTEGIPFKLVVEPQEEGAYRERWGAERVLTLPANNQGLVFSRNWIKSYATQKGHERHWQFDDDIRKFYRHHHGRRIKAPARVALCVLEDFVDRYENV